VNVSVVPGYPLSSYREPAEPRSLFALALLTHQANAQDIFAVVQRHMSKEKGARSGALAL
jgi:hypothetical protein